MNKKIVDITGQKFGKLTVISFSHTYGGKAYWNCICDCGKEKVVCSNLLKNEKTKSCGCSTHKRVKDFTNQKFYHFTALKFIKRDEIKKNYLLVM